MCRGAVRQLLLCLPSVLKIDVQIYRNAKRFHASPPPCSLLADVLQQENINDTTALLFYSLTGHIGRSNTIQHLMPQHHCTDRCAAVATYCCTRSHTPWSAAVRTKTQPQHETAAHTAVPLPSPGVGARSWHYCGNTLLLRVLLRSCYTAAATLHCWTYC